MIDWCGLPITLKTVIVHDILKGSELPNGDITMSLSS